METVSVVGAPVSAPIVPPKVVAPPQRKTLSPAAPKLVQSLSEIRNKVIRDKASPYLIEGLLKKRSVNLVVGKSGIGKSPLILQAGLCIASAKPFLGMPTEKGKVLVADYENGEGAFLSITETLCRFLGIELPEEDFKSLDLQAVAGDDLTTMTQAIASFKPDLVIIDPLRQFDTKAAEDNESASRLMKKLHKLATAHNSAFILVHHPRKLSEEVMAGGRKVKERMSLLRSEDVNEWMNCASGAGALLNHSDTRLGVEVEHNLIVDENSIDEETDSALVLRWNRRATGDGGPTFALRVFENGEPVGYRQFSQVSLLRSPNQVRAYHLLSRNFSFTEARKHLGRGDQATSLFIKKLQGIGLAEKTDGGYRKIG